MSTSEKHSSKPSFSEFIKYYIQLSETDHPFFGAKGDFSGRKRGKEEISESGPGPTESKSTGETTGYREFEKLKIFQFRFLDPATFTNFAISNIETLRDLSINMLWMWNDSDVLRETKKIHDNLPGMSEFFLKDREIEVLLYPATFLKNIFPDTTLNLFPLKRQELLEEIQCFQVMLNESNRDLNNDLAWMIKEFGVGSEHYQGQIHSGLSTIDLEKIVEQRRGIAKKTRPHSYSIFKGSLDTYLVTYFVAPFLRMIHTELTLDFKLNRKPQPIKEDSHYVLYKTFRLTEEQKKTELDLTAIFRENEELNPEEDIGVKRSTLFPKVPEMITTGEDPWFIQSIRLNEVPRIKEILGDNERQPGKRFPIIKSVKKVGFRNAFTQKWELQSTLKTTFFMYSNFGPTAVFGDPMIDLVATISRVILINEESYFVLLKPMIHPDSLYVENYLHDLENSQYLVNEEMLQCKNCIKKPHLTIFEALFEIVVWQAQVRDFSDDDTPSANASRQLKIMNANSFFEFIQSLATLSEDIPDFVIEGRHFPNMYILPVQLDKFYASGVIAEEKKQKQKSNENQWKWSKTKGRLENAVINAIFERFEMRKEASRDNLSLLLFHLCFTTFSAYFNMKPKNSTEAKTPLDFEWLTRRIEQKLKIPSLAKEGVMDILRDVERSFLKMLFVYSFLKKSPFTVYPVVNRMVLTEFIVGLRRD